MYKSKIRISTETKNKLVKKLNDFLVKNKKIYCRSLKRKIYLNKLPETIIRRKTSASKRLQRFFVAIDILKHEKKFKVRENKGCLEYEIIELDSLKNKVYIHLREELTLKKDRILYFVSCY